MKNVILAAIFFILLSSFNSEVTCMSSEDIALIKNDVKKNIFFKEYTTKNVSVFENTDLHKECTGLFYVCINAKNNSNHIYIPYLKIGDKTLYNCYVYEGQKVLKDTTGMNSKLLDCLRYLKNNFNKEQIDSIKTNFLYGVYSVSNRKM